MSDPPGDGAVLGVVGGVATLTLGDGRHRNAIRLSTWRALPRLVAAADRDDMVGVIVLRGACGVFGAGNDIAELAALRGDPEAAYAYGRAMADAIAALETASKPILVAVQGLCYGASVALALAGDVRVAAADATFAITPAKLGAMYLRSDLHRLVAAVGPGRAKQLIYFAGAIGADRAREIGLVDEVVAAEAFEAALALLTDAVLRGSPYTLSRSKAALGALQATPLETRESLAAFVESIQGRDFSNGVDAFLARRPPRFR